METMTLTKLTLNSLRRSFRLVILIWFSLLPFLKSVTPPPCDELWLFLYVSHFSNNWLLIIVSLSFVPPAATSANRMGGRCVSLSSNSLKLAMSEPPRLLLFSKGGWLEVTGCSGLSMSGKSRGNSTSKIKVMNRQFLLSEDPISLAR